MFGVALGLYAVTVVSFCYFNLAFGVGSFPGCGGFVVSVFSLLLGFLMCGGFVFAFTATTLLN